MYGIDKSLKEAKVSFIQDVSQGTVEFLPDSSFVFDDGNKNQVSLEPILFNNKQKPARQFLRPPTIPLDQNEHLEQIQVKVKNF